MSSTTTEGDVMVDAAMTIGGKPFTTGRWAPVPNPACLTQTVGQFAQGDADCADRAVAAAADALAGWSATPVSERALLLASAVTGIGERIPEWSALLTRESGKTPLESAADLGAAAGFGQFYSAQAGQLAETRITDEQGTLIIRHKPFGVCVGMIPWNFPIALSAVKFAPALLAGNTMVLKAPDFAPLTLLAVIQHVASHLPPGVLNIVSGTDPELGARLASHPDVRKVSFTGGKDVGTKVMRSAADNVAAVTLELGGNDAAILLDDFEVTPESVNQIVTGAFAVAGQICFAIKRLYVHDSRFEETCAALEAAINSIVVGDPMQPGVTMGPVNNARQHTFLKGLIERTRESGATIRELGSLAAETDCDNGYFVRPHLVLDPPDTADIVACEQFGPVLPVMSYTDDDEVVERANATEYGLGSSVWSADERRALQIADRLQAGTTFINSHSIYTVDIDAPFGGVKHSGTGRELGTQGLLEYTQTHAITSRHP